MSSINQQLDFNAEAVLDPGIRPEDFTFEFVREPTAIFLTGATGFIGAFLIAELLKQTKADIYCLVRRVTNIEEARERIRQNLEFYQVWDESLSYRIIPVVGDLSNPRFGLDPQQFNALASQIDVIYHCGALVKWMRNYEDHKAINVLGTQEVLKLATQFKLKPVHFISTMEVLEVCFSSKVILEQDILEEKECHAYAYGGYVQSKWVSEKLVRLAGLRGLPISIYRFNLTGGSSQTGIWNTSDLFLAKIIKGCIQLGIAAEMDWTVDMTPVDYQVKAIAYLSRQKSSFGKTFHPLHPPVQWSKIVKSINSFGYPVKLVSLEKWIAEFLTQAKSVEDNALYKFLPGFSDPEAVNAFFQKRQWNCQKTLEALKGTDIICPPVDEKYISTILNYFIRSGFLEAPLVRT